MNLWDAYVEAIYLVLPIVFLPALLTMKYYAKRAGEKSMHRKLKNAGLINPQKLYR